MSESLKGMDNKTSNINEIYTYEVIRSIADYIKEKTNNFTPEIGITCGSGIGQITDIVTDPLVIPYSSIPNFITTSVKGHKGEMIFGKVNKQNVVCMSGRIHPYEGYDPAFCAVPIKVLKLLGVKTLIITAAAGALNEKYKPGDLMVIKDHINFASLGGRNPLVGPEDLRFGTNFVPMTGLYTREYRQLLRLCAKELDLAKDLQEGVYVYSGGPTYETVAECIFMRNCNADAVGMSVVYESTVAKYLGIKVLGIALITNMCCMDADREFDVTHDDVLVMSASRITDLQNLLIFFISQFPLD